MSQGQLTGRKVFFITASAFSVIITVNMILAFNAVATFPGLETKNSYVASQSFDDRRAAQDALGWDVSATVSDGVLELSFVGADGPVAPEIEQAIFGRATHTGNDQMPEFVWNGASFTAPVELAPGNWNLRLKARAADGTQFERRFPIRIQPQT